jgi:hypothetical protein
MGEISKLRQLNEKIWYGVVRDLGFNEMRWFLKVVKLCLESFRSGNLVHFQSEQRKSCRTGTRFDPSEKKFSALLN